MIITFLKDNGTYVALDPTQLKCANVSETQAAIGFNFDRPILDENKKPVLKNDIPQTEVVFQPLVYFPIQVTPVKQPEIMKEGVVADVQVPEKKTKKARVQ